MARVKGPLIRRSSLVGAAAIIIVTFGPISPAVSIQSETAGPAYMKPMLIEGKAFPVLLPIDGRWLNWRDTYGAPRMRLEGGIWQQTGRHQGIDIYAERGSPVVSIVPGMVENAGWTFYSGWRVGVRGDDGRYYFYAHLLRSLAPGAVVGARVSAGQALGHLGSSGYGPEGTSEEFPPHLHFGLQQQSGTWANPQQMLQELYATTAAQLEDARRRMDGAEMRAEVLRSRAYLPGTPPHDALVAAVNGALAERDSLRSSIAWES